MLIAAGQDARFDHAAPVVGRKTGFGETHAVVQQAWPRAQDVRDDNTLGIAGDRREGQPAVRIKRPEQQDIIWRKLRLCIDGLPDRGVRSASAEGAQPGEAIGPAALAKMADRDAAALLERRREGFVESACQLRTVVARSGVAA